MFVLPVENNFFELNFSEMETACCSAPCLHFNHYLVRTKLENIPKRETTPRIGNLFRELFQVFDRKVTKSASLCQELLG